MKNISLFFISILLAFTSCVGDDFLEDFVGQSLRITSTIDSLEINTTFQFEKMYLNNIGQEEIANVIWNSSNTDIIEIDQNGLATAKQKGTATISIEFETDTETLKDEVIVVVGETTVITQNRIEGRVETTTFYDLAGDFVYYEDGDKILLEFGEDYIASNRLPGLYVYLSNNKSSIAGAFEIGKVTTFRGAHTYELEGIGFNDYKHIVYFCKPFNVKVGDGTIQD